MAIDDWARAIASIESAGSGGYSALGPVTQKGNRAYGKYQVMDFNIGPWTEKYLGKRLTPQEFLASPEAQEAVFRGEFGGNVEKYGSPQEAASVWFTGQPMSRGANRKDILGTTGSGYIDKFNRALGNPQASYATPTIMTKGGQAVEPDQIKKDAMAQSTGIMGMAGGQQRQAMGGSQPRQTMGERFRDPNFWNELALAFHSMSSFPNEAAIRSLESRVSTARERRREQDQINKTIAFFEKANMPQLAELARVSPTAAINAYGQMVKPATEGEAIKQYRLAVEQGFKGTFMDYKTALAKAGSSSITVGDGYKVAGDYVLTPDPSSPAGVRFVPIPGSKAAIAAEAEKTRSGTVAAQQEQKESVVTKSIDRLINMLDTKGIFNLPEAGIVGNMLGNLGINQEAVTFRNELMTVQSNVAFDRLQQMREASKTGGALGAVSERELDLLMAAYGNLQQSTDPKILRENLEDIKRIMTKIENDPVASQIYYNGFAGAQSGQAPSGGGFSVTGKVGN